MKKSILIKSITLLNFKGIQKLTIAFENVTNIFGDNGTGKTSVFDAFVWLFFGKDSTDRKDFQVKTLDKHNNVIPKIDHEVSAVVNIDGKDVTIKRILRENWVKKRGSEIAEFAGNETLYYWDEVPVQLKDFTTRVNGILDELVFKIISNPMAFNAMNWKDRRNILINIVGDVSNEDVLNQILTPDNGDIVAELTEILNSGKSLSDYQKQIAASIKKAKDDIKLIPTRIDEVNRTKPEALDFVSLRGQLETKNTELAGVERDMTDKSSAYDSALQGVNDKKRRASNLKYEIETIEANARREASNQIKPDTSEFDRLTAMLTAKRSNLLSVENGIASTTTQIEGVKSAIQSLETKMAEKRAEWNTENAKELTFNDSEFCCPTCQREFEEGDKETKKAELLQNFKTAKHGRLAEISGQGHNLASQKQNQETELANLQSRLAGSEQMLADSKAEIVSVEGELETAKSKLVPNNDQDEQSIYQNLLSLNAEYKDKKAELDTLSAQIGEEPKVDLSELQIKRDQLKTDIDAIKTQLQREAQITAVENRVKELEAEERELASQIAGVEKTQFVIENFTKMRIETLERKINEKFKYVRFKMFDTQINGGEVECCDALINGVPFSDANTASKINAGLDIINTLCDYYKITAPIFIDNRESVVSLIETESQVINLIVSESDKQLRVA